jgi:CHAD domain-containing protein
MVQQTVSEIARGSFLIQLQAIQAQLPGCIEGKDPIHLHDLRVANRRNRAALIEFKGLLPGEVFNTYQDNFRWIHLVTGEVRDLDVTLQQFPIYQKQLIKGTRSYIKPLKTLLEDKREKAQLQLVKDLESDHLGEILRNWADLLQGDCLDKTSLSLEPAREHGCRRIVKRYLQVKKKGGKLNKKTPAEAFHIYRISIKKLRYLMEFFRPALDNDQFSSLRTGLKTVQDAFGAYQDAEVQEITIRSLAGELYQQGAPIDTLLILGQLVGYLEKKGRQNKKVCLRQVRWITEDATGRAFQTCFQYPVGQ